MPLGARDRHIDTMLRLEERLWLACNVWLRHELLLRICLLWMSVTCLIQIRGWEHLYVRKETVKVLLD